MRDVTSIDARDERPHRPAPCYVRVTHPDRRGFVEFQFSMGDPTLFLEMTLPRAAFGEFCARHGARRLSTDEARAVDAAESRWRHGADHGEPVDVD